MSDLIRVLTSLGDTWAMHRNSVRRRNVNSSIFSRHVGGDDGTPCDRTREMSCPSCFVAGDTVRLYLGPTAYLDSHGLPQASPRRAQGLHRVLRRRCAICIHHDRCVARAAPRWNVEEG